MHPFKSKFMRSMTNPRFTFTVTEPVSEHDVEIIYVWMGDMINHFLSSQDIRLAAGAGDSVCMYVYANG